MAEQMVLGMWPTSSHLLSPKQHSVIRVVRIPHIGTKIKPLSKAGRSNILVNVVATYDAFQDVLGFLCRHVLRCLLDVHAHVNVLAANNGMIQGYMENLVTRRILVIKRIIFFRDHL